MTRYGLAPPGDGDGRGAPVVGAGGCGVVEPEAVEPEAGIEPATSSLQVKRSTN